MTRSLDRFRALTSRDDNSIRWVCTGENPTSDERSLPTAGNFTEFEIPSNRFCRFTSIYPALLAQFSIGGATSSLFAADPSMTIIPPAGQYKDSYMLNYFSGQIVTNFVNIFLLATPGITTDGVSLDKAPISGTWSGISCEEGNEVCAYGIQVEITGTESGVVTLAHSNPDAKLLGISYSTDIRTSRASHSGMTQKPIARKTTTKQTYIYQCNFPPMAKYNGRVFLCVCVCALSFTHSGHSVTVSVGVQCGRRKWGGSHIDQQDWRPSR